MQLFVIKLNHKSEEQLQEFLSLEFESRYLEKEFESCLFKFTRDTFKPVTSQQNESCAFLTQK